ncbi:MAG TPA: HAD-IC family P-type ATPase, partial [Spirochaetia bacterium]|nr:HAD-IC family P-type ATPase [Spirochaetia bacterium]
MSTKALEEMTVAAAFEAVTSGPEGLSEREAKERLSRYGHNEIEEKRKRPVLDFLKRFWGPMPWLLELAMVLAIILGHDVEGGMILVLLTVNAIIGHVHSRNSQRAVEMLKSRLAVRAKLLRDGAWSLHQAREIVPGDIVAVRIGDVVPADAKILEGEVSVDQSALTGESLPVDRGLAGILYSGSSIKRGQARCVVMSTGAGTYFGKTAELVRIAKPKSHQEEVMLQVVRSMMYLGIAATIVVAAYAAALHISFLVIMTFAVIFLMGAVPVALPAVLTIVQAVGAVELSRKGALVTRLDSIEDAASIDSLCLDKTGTITQNTLRVTEIVPLGAFSADEVLRLASLASRGDALDVLDLAVLERAASLPKDGYRPVSFTPFDPSTKRTEATVDTAGGRLRIVKGAPQIVMALTET